MSLQSDLLERVARIANEDWKVVSGRTIPDAEDSRLTLLNSGISVDVAILYADLHRSTEMVDSLGHERAGEYYKAFLHCAASIIRANSGELTSYDGDRVMGVFIGDDDVFQAVQAALQLNGAVKRIINPIFNARYLTMHRPLLHTVGIDRSNVLVAKTGIRNHNDLVWIGSAANYASKLNSFQGLDINFPTRITLEAHTQIVGQFYRQGATLLSPPTWEGPFLNVGKRHYRTNLWMPP